MRRLMLATAALATLVSGASGMAQPRQGGYGGQGGGQGGYGGGAPQAAAPAPTAAPAQPSGSFSQSCSNVRVQGQTVTAECKDIHSGTTTSSINFTACRGDLANRNGVLECPGATGTVVSVQSNNRGNNNNGGVAAGVAGGALLGFLGGQAYQGQREAPPQAPPPGPPPQQQQDGYDYPAYGDAHYGDPRYDSRYGPQGWGNGHQAGEWVGIRDRAPWLNRRIDRAIDSGYMSRREAQDIRRDLDGLESLEYRYLKQGLTPWMRADLDHRFSGLARRTRDSGPSAPPPPPPPRDDRGYYGH